MKTLITHTLCLLSLLAVPMAAAEPDAVFDVLQATNQYLAAVSAEESQNANTYVDASKQTTRVSANVSGLFGTSRIALNDNLLLRANPDGVEAVMGHEIGHYVLNHQWKLITYMLLIIAACFALTKVLFKVISARRSEAWGLRGIDDYAAFPLLNAVATTLIFLCTPLLYSVIYVHEYEADLFAINATQNPEASAEVALLTAEYRKLHPPAWEEAWLNHHPSPYVRIVTAMRWRAENLPVEVEVHEDEN
jgi:STE24 endopeptidase